MTTIKNFAFNFSDLAFMRDQIRFRPLYDANGKPIINWDGVGPIFDVHGNLLWDGNGMTPEQATGMFGSSFATYTSSQGLRNVDGLSNNLFDTAWGNTDLPFLQRTQVVFDRYLKPLDSADPNAYYAAKFATSPDPAAADYTKTEANLTEANVTDYTPRMISRTITTADVTFATEPGGTHLVKDANGFTSVADYGMLQSLGQQDAQPSVNADGSPNTEWFIGATNPGVAPVNGWFVLFGQFFDHGLDFVGKGGDGTKITITLAPDDPMYGVIDPTSGRPATKIVISRADVSGFTENGTPQWINHTSPYIDQSQTYGSHAELTALLREWVRDPVSGNWKPGMNVLDGATSTPWTNGWGEMTNATLPTLNELRAHLIATDRDDLSWEDVLNLRARDASGQVVDADAGVAGIQALATGAALLLDMNPRFDAARFGNTLNPDAGAAFDANIDTLAAAAQDLGCSFGYDANAGTICLDVPAEMMGPGSPAAHLTGASALYFWVNFGDFSIKTTMALGPTIAPVSQAVHDAVSDLLLAAVGDHYIAGDGRANENIGLTAVHHVFHEEHNYQVRNIIEAIRAQDAREVALDEEGVYDHQVLHDWQVDTGMQDAAGNYVDAGGAIAWDQEKIFQAAKMTVEMEYQHTAVDQFARTITPNLHEFVGYNSGENATISLDFAQVAYRFGHSTLRESIDIMDPDGNLSGAVMRLALEQAFLSPEKFAQLGAGAIAMGMTHQQANEVDEFLTPALNQGLLGQPLDLAAINIARGRDLGVPTLNDMREALQLTRYTSWSDFGANMIHPDNLVNFIAAYAFDGDVSRASVILALANDDMLETDPANVWNYTVADAVNFLNNTDPGLFGVDGFEAIDCWIGGLAEVHVTGGLLGETFDTIFVDQIGRVMDGDRFYYLQRLSNINYGQEIIDEQFKDIIERTTGARHLNGSAFAYADKYFDLAGQADATGDIAAAQAAVDDAQAAYDATVAASNQADADAASAASAAAAALATAAGTDAGALRATANAAASAAAAIGSNVEFASLLAAITAATSDAAALQAAAAAALAQANLNDAASLQALADAAAADDAAAAAAQAAADAANAVDLQAQTDSAVADDAAAAAAQAAALLLAQAEADALAALQAAQAALDTLIANGAAQAEIDDATAVRDLRQTDYNNAVLASDAGEAAAAAAQTLADATNAVDLQAQTDAAVAADGAAAVAQAQAALADAVDLQSQADAAAADDAAAAVAQAAAAAAAAADANVLVALNAYIAAVAADQSADATAASTDAAADAAEADDATAAAANAAAAAAATASAAAAAAEAAALVALTSLQADLTTLQTEGNFRNQHKYATQLAANPNLGIYSDGGSTTLLNGDVVWVGGRQYIRDVRTPTVDTAAGNTAGFALDGAPNSGAESHEVIVASDRDDLIYARGGDDTVYGEDGRDIIYGGNGIDRLYGGDGDDTIFGADGGDLIDGGKGDDVLFGGQNATAAAGIDQIIGAEGNDYIDGGIGIDKLSGGAGDDVIFGGGDTDAFTHGGDGNDYIDGGVTGDLLWGDGGSDLIVGQADQDILAGMDGDDILRPGPLSQSLTGGGDEVMGGDGLTDKGENGKGVGFDLIDLSDWQAAPVGALIDFSTQQNPLRAIDGNPQFPAWAGIEGAIGSRNDDIILGDETANWLIGGSGNDVLAGARGDDLIVGDGIRLDTLIGTYASSYGDTFDDASHRATGFLQKNGLLDAIGLGDQKHLTEMLKSAMFKDMVLGGSEVSQIWRNGVAQTTGESAGQIGDGGVAGAADVAAFSGLFADYVFSRVFFDLASRSIVNTASATTIQVVRVHDNVADRDGDDVVLGVESFRFSDGNGGTRTLTFREIFNNAPTGDFVINGQPAREGSTLSATVGAIQDADGINLATRVIQWQSSVDGLSWSPIPGANAADFTPPALPGMGVSPFAGNLFRAVVTYTDNAGFTEEVITAPTGPMGIIWSAATSATGVTFTSFAGGDSLTGSGQADTLDGAAGDDTINGGGGADTLFGGAGVDTLLGGGGNDTLTGGAGDDTIDGQAGGGDVAVFAGPVASYTYGTTLLGFGSDLVITDTVGDGGTDTVARVETLRIAGVNYAVVMGNLGNDNALNGANGAAGSQIVFARTGNDTLNGGAASDILVGGNGNDTLVGGADNDFVFGDAGADTIIQGSTEGRDFIDGGAGVDTYILNGLAGTAETFTIYARAAAVAAGFGAGLDADTEIVVTRSVGAGPQTIIAELDNIEEIVVNALQTTAENNDGVVNGGTAGGDTITVVGDFTAPNTSLLYNTITINGSDANDTVDITGLQSDHRIVFTTNGGADTLLGSARPQDTINGTVNDQRTTSLAGPEVAASVAAATVVAAPVVAAATVVADASLAATDVASTAFGANDQLTTSLAAPEVAASVAAVTAGAAASVAAADVTSTAFGAFDGLDALVRSGLRGSLLEQSFGAADGLLRGAPGRVEFRMLGLDDLNIFSRESADVTPMQQSVGRTMIDTPDLAPLDLASDFGPAHMVHQAVELASAHVDPTGFDYRPVSDVMWVLP